MRWGAIFLALFAAALVILWLARRIRVGTGLPSGRLVYVDTTHWQPVERPLFSRSHRLTGRPDYLLSQRRNMIPVEVKTGHAPPNGPHASHTLQLAAYCVLVEEMYERRPPYGIILYTDDADQAYTIDYSPALEEKLLVILDNMRRSLAEGNAPRDHEHAARCQGCGYRSGCQQTLV